LGLDVSGSSLGASSAEALLLSEGELLGRQPPLIPDGLAGLDGGQDGPEALVLDDVSLADDGVLVEDGVRQQAALAVQLDAAVLPFVDANDLAGT
jgi:hypothetical protein